MVRPSDWEDVFESAELPFKIAFYRRKGASADMASGRGALLGPADLELRLRAEREQHAAEMRELKLTHRAAVAKHCSIHERALAHIRALKDEVDAKSAVVAEYSSLLRDERRKTEALRRAVRELKALHEASIDDMQRQLSNLRLSGGALAEQPRFEEKAQFVEFPNALYDEEEDVQWLPGEDEDEDNADFDFRDQYEQNSDQEPSDVDRSEEVQGDGKDVGVESDGESGTSPDYEMDIREAWRVGDVLEVFSVGLEEWVTAEVISVTPSERGNLLDVMYKDGTAVKLAVNCFDPSIRPSSASNDEVMFAGNVDHIVEKLRGGGLDANKTISLAGLLELKEGAEVEDDEEDQDDEASFVSKEDRARVLMAQNVEFDEAFDVDENEYDEGADFDGPF